MINWEDYMKRTSRIIIKLLAVILLFFTTTMPNVSAESSKDLGDIFSNIVLMKGEDIITKIVGNKQKSKNFTI